MRWLMWCLDCPTPQVNPAVQPTSCRNDGSANIEPFQEDLRGGGEAPFRFIGVVIHCHNGGEGEDVGCEMLSLSRLQV